MQESSAHAAGGQEKDAASVQEGTVRKDQNAAKAVDDVERLVALRDAAGKNADKSGCEPSTVET